MAKPIAPVVLALSLGCRLCPGQSAPDALTIGSVTVHGSIRSRVEGWQWFKGQGNSDYVFWGSLLRLSFSQESPTFDWRFEFSAPILLGLPDNAVAPGAQGQLGHGASYYVANHRSQNAAMIFPNQAYLRFKKLFGSEANALRIGRFEFADGGEVTPKDPTLATLKRDRITQRLIGPFTYTHVERSFYGIHYQHDAPDLNWTVLGAFPSRGVFQVDGWGLMKTAFGYASATRPLHGKSSSAEWRVFGIYYDDWRGILKTDNRTLGARQSDHNDLQIGTFGGHFLHSAKTNLGTTDLLAWGAVQTGRWGNLNQRAASFDIEGGLQPPILEGLKPWIRFGYTYASGDGNSKDGTHGTFFPILPTSRQFARFPFFNMMNNEDLFGILMVRPGKTLTLRSEFHDLRLASRTDLWYLGGGAFQPWTFGYQGRPSNGGKGLANLYDISGDYAFNPNTSVTVYWGYAQGHSVIAGIYPNNKNGSLGFIEFNFKF
jgi:hypothetical protein